MNLRKNIVLITGGGVTLVLTLVCVFFLFRYRADYGNVQAELQTTNDRLTQLSRRNPFPNEANVKQADENLARMQDEFARLMEEFRKGSVEAQDMEPAQFAGYGMRLMRGLNVEANTNGVTVPDNFAYGFNRYARGAIPAKEDLSRLVLQIGSVSRIMEAIFSARIREIKSVDRHVFEDEVKAAAAPAAGDALAAAAARRPTFTGETEAANPEAAAGFFESPDKLYVRERVILTFVADEKQLWQAMNALARLPMMCSIAWMEIVNEASKPVLRDPKKMGGEELALGLPPAGEIGLGGVQAVTNDPNSLIVAGNTETLTVRMAVDYFNFRSQVRDAGKEMKP